MSRFSQACCLWPGLHQLWGGGWSGLALAIGFSLALNLTLITSLVWTEMSTLPLRIAVWATLGLIWAGAAVFSWRRMPRLPSAKLLEANEGLFNSAQSEYLKGNWFAAETALNQILSHNAADGDAQIMLAGLLRRTGRLSDAAAQLLKLEQSAAHTKWWPEIIRERQWLKQREARQAEQAAEAVIAADSEQDLAIDHAEGLDSADCEIARAA